MRDGDLPVGQEGVVEVRAESLDFQKMLHRHPETDQLFIRDQRVIINSAAALGMLRRDLIVNLGMERAQGFLKRYGYSIGSNDAANLKNMYHWADDKEWLLAGPTIHSLQGHTKSIVTRLEVDREKGHIHMEGYWDSSYEAEQHLHFFGQHKEAVCWTVAGYASGYCSTFLGKPVVFKEVECVGKGDKRCYNIGKTVEEWGKEAESELAYYQETHLAEELEEAYSRIRTQHLQLMRVMEIHGSMTDLILQGKGLQELAQVLGGILDCWISVEDIHFQSLAFFHPKQTVGDGGNWSMARLFQQGSREIRQSLDRMLKERRGVVFPRQGDGCAMRLASPIVTGHDVVGYISMGRDNDRIGELDVMALERASAICALFLLNERKIMEVEQRLRGDFLEELMSGGATVESLDRRARHMGLKPHHPHRVLVLHAANFEAIAASQRNLRDEVRLQEDIGLRVRDISTNLLGKEILQVPKRDKVILFLSDEWLEKQRMTPRKAAEELQSALQKAFPQFRFRVGIGAAYSEVKQLKLSYDEALYALEATEGSQGKSVVAYEDLGIYGLLLHTRNPEELRAFGLRWLGPLIEYDKRHQSELVATLKSFLINDSNVHKTSRAMNISINGLRYRLQRIREIGNLDLDSSDVRFQLYLALQVYAMAGSGAN